MLIKNFENWIIDKEVPFGSGTRVKDWLTTKDNKMKGLFKYPKLHTDDDNSITAEHLSEKLAYDIGKLIGIECAKVDIGYFNNKMGSMSYLITDPAKEILIEGIHYISSSYPYYDESKLYDYKNKEYYSLEMILKSIQSSVFKNKILEMCVFDFLIGNSDRHHSNWATIRNENNEIRMSPLYDNGSSLCCYIEEKNIADHFKDKMRFNSLCDTKSKSIIRLDKTNKKTPTHLEFLKELRRTYYYQTRGLVDVIKSNINENNIISILNKYDEDVMSSERKELIKRYLIRKVERMSGIYE